ncbi:hypothetical protein EP7_004273 [Isosphaeraceae bacterium EP7]
MAKSKKTPKRKLKVIAVTLRHDMKWVVPFVWAVCEKYERTVGDIFRRAFSTHFANRPGEGFVGGVGSKRRDLSRFWFTIPKQMEWMSEALDAEATRQNLSPCVIMFIAFCEVYGKEFPELSKLYQAWKNVNAEAA